MKRENCLEYKAYNTRKLKLKHKLKQQKLLVLLVYSRQTKVLASTVTAT